MNRGSVWWTDFEPATGGEIKKTRPAVIISNDRANTTLNRVVVAPFTGNVKRIYPGNAVISLMGKDGKFLADQIRTVDKQRLRSKICELTPYDIQKINTAIRLHLVL